MLEKFIHVNSKNQTLDFTALGIFANYNDLRDFEWSTLTNNNKITKLYKGIVKKSIPFVFIVDKAKAAEIKNAFYEHFEYDVLNSRKGYFMINGYKYYCYVTKSVKSDYLLADGYLKIKVDITTDEPHWYKETTKTILFNNGATYSAVNSLTYAFKYPFIYKSGGSARIVNDDFVDSNGIIRIYGFAENPVVKINENVYQVITTIYNGEYLEIDTANKTIYKYSILGERTSLFNYRNKNYDIFKLIPSGTLTVEVNSNFAVDIVIREQRGEPKWN